MPVSFRWDVNLKYSCGHALGHSISIIPRPIVIKTLKKSIYSIIMDRILFHMVAEICMHVNMYG